MACQHNSPDRRIPARLAAITAVLAAIVGLLLTPDVARAQFDPHFRAILSYNNYRGDDLTSSYFDQNYEIRTTSVWGATQFLGFLRLRDNLGTTLVAGQSRRFNTLVLQPRIETLFTWNPYFLQILWDLFAENGTIEGVASGQRRLNRLLGTFSWAPEGVAVPRLDLTAERRTVRDVIAGLDSAANNLVGQLSYRKGEVSASGIGIFATFDDAPTRFQRQTFQFTGGLGYLGVPIANQLSVNANWSITVLGMTERSASGNAVLAPLEVLPTRGLAVIDDTPLDNADRPMVSYPTLIDRDFRQPVGISLGPSGQSWWNIGVDMGRVVELDELLLSVRDATGNPVPLGGPITWSVYTSPDGVFWTPVVTAMTATFVPAISAYQIDFPVRRDRYFKVVNFGVNLVDTQVTEIQALTHTAVGPGGRSTNSLLNNAVLSLIWTPLRWLSLTSNSLLNTARQNLDPGGQTSNTDWDQFVGLTLTPIDLLDLNLSAQIRGATASGGFSTRTNIETGTLTLRWLPDLRSTIQAQRTATDVSTIGGGTPSTVQENYTFSNYALFLRTLDLSLTLGYLHQTLAAGGSFYGERVYTTLVSHAMLTTWLDLFLTGYFQSAFVAQQAVPGGDGTSTVIAAAATVDRRASAEFWYHPSSQFMVNLRLGWAATPAYAGPAGFLRVQWYPVPGADVRLNLIFEQDVDASLGQRSQRFAVSPYWQVNRFTSLTLNWQLLTYSNRYQSSRNESFFATLYINL